MVLTVNYMDNYIIYCTCEGIFEELYYQYKYNSKMSSFEIEFAQCKEEIHDIKDEIRQIYNGEGIYLTWTEDKKNARIMLEKQLMLSKETLIILLLRKNLGKNNCKIFMYCADL